MRSTVTAPSPRSLCSEVTQAPSDFRTESANMDGNCTGIVRFLCNKIMGSLFADFPQLAPEGSYPKKMARCLFEDNTLYSQKVTNYFAFW